MQTACWEMPWVRALRAVALMLAVVLGLEWTVPLGGYAQPNQEPAQPNQEPAQPNQEPAQPNQEPASAPAASVENQDLPPMQKAESVEVESPIYKK